MEEIGVFNRSQIEAFKELITKSTIRERRAYGVFSEDYVRRASFAGATNNKQLQYSLSALIKKQTPFA